MITIDGMAKKHRTAGEVGHWKGDAVERRPNDEAEAAANRAEGNERIPAAVESERLAHPDPEAEPRQAQHRSARGDDPEEDTAEAAEAHQARDAAERPPRGKL